MSGDSHLEGLLHLAALAIAVVAGYIGLDKIGREKVGAAIDKLVPDIEAEDEENKKILTSLDLYKPNHNRAFLHPLFGMYWQYLLCCVNDIPYTLRVEHARFGSYIRD